jgi:hypothetical protein
VYQFSVVADYPDGQRRCGVVRIIGIQRQARLAGLINEYRRTE